jgi:uncharacterized protein
VLVARRREQEVLRDALESREAELVAVYGRRRIGKTFLVREFFGTAISFELTGSHASDMATQLTGFAAALGRASSTTGRLAAPRDWPEAFEQLEAHLKARSRHRTKRVVFFDELPWLATRRSGFLAAFEHFWNGWASAQPWLVVVICGSSASWMLSKVITQRGGLHNRVTRRLRLAPLSLAESREYLHARGVTFGDEQVLELYMAFGGVPHYLNQAKPGQSAAQTIDSACFARDGLLREEFSNLYAALFERADRHEAVIRALAKRRTGMTRGDLLASAGLDSGGTASKVLDELEQSGFIARRVPIGRSVRDALYQLVDHFSLFHLAWIAGHRSGRSDGTWLRVRAGPRHSAWSGLAFESVCLGHIEAIKHVLGIGAVETQEAPWWHRPVDADDEGAQVDLVIDRADRSTNLCEMKYVQGELVVDKAQARELERKREVFRRISRTRKALFLTVVTTVGVRANEHAQRLGLQVVTLAGLMRARS